ncbi:MAG: hypothetical protein GY898_00630 [Proteobacteria bacterium]|nr:hypothetical protein [Pseudomonadota bacterium]
MTRSVNLILLAGLLLSTVGCGPALRYRPADTLPKGMVEVGGGFAAAARADEGDFGGTELQGWLRGGVHDRVEIGGRFWSYSFVSFGGAFEMRAQLVRGPIDLSLDLGALAGACCGAGDRNKTLAAAVGVDAGLTFGKRFGGVRGPAFYIAPHVQYSRVLPLAQNWPIQLFLPVGADIPLGPSPFSIRPEFFAAALFHEEGVVRWRVGGGIGFAIRGPSAKLARERRLAKKKAEEDPEAAMRKRYGLEKAE